ncbi:MAG TPA: hypothetical protein VFV94_18080 [Polyangiaceae bacterium]|jgi:hypothetical protein|nr:hypothetical protein [Polyangiaceae bacterium]
MAPRASLALFLLLGGCFPSGEGVDPPTDRSVYFPVGLALDADASHLFIANSDFDLQYNSGTVVSWNLDAVRARLPQTCAVDADCTDPAKPRCDAPAPGEQPVAGNPRSYWCVADTGNYQGACGSLGELSPAERQLYPGRCRFILPQRDGILVDSVRIGAFATDIVYRTRPPSAAGTEQGRLFVPVRGDATLHWIDVLERGGVPGRLECGQSEPDQEGECADDHRRGNRPAAENTRGDSLLPEPFGIDADETARFVMVTNQTSSALGLFQNTWGEGSGVDNGPSYQFTLQFSDGQPMGIGAVPRPWADVVAGNTQGPDFLTSFRGTPWLQLVRVFADADSNPPRPYTKAVQGVRILANANGSDSRGLAIDGSLRRLEEQRCAERFGIDLGCALDPGCTVDNPDYLACLNTAAAVPLDVLVTNRAPPSLLVGHTQRETLEQPGPLDVPAIQLAMALGYGPARVVVGPIVNPQGERERRAFAVCFDSRRIVVYDIERQRIDTEILTGRGPQAFVVDAEHSLGYVAHFTDSYIGVVDLDQRHPRTYGAIIGSIEQPVAPRSSK